MSGPLTATGRKVVAIHGSALLDDVLGIEQELIEQRDALAEDEQACHEEVERLRATLDAARAAAPPVADQVEELERTIHPEGRCQVCGDGKPYWKHNANPTEYHAFVPPASPEPTPGLRDAAQKFLWEAEAYRTAHYNGTHMTADGTAAWAVREREFEKKAKALRAALAASPAPEPTGLDVERTEEQWRERIERHLGPQRRSIYMGRDLDMMARGAYLAARLTGEGS